MLRHNCVWLSHSCEPSEHSLISFLRHSNQIRVKLSRKKRKQRGKMRNRIDSPTHCSIRARYWYPSSHLLLSLVLALLPVSRISKHLYEPSVLRHAWLPIWHFAAPVSHSSISSQSPVSTFRLYPVSHLENVIWVSTLVVWRDETWQRF